MQKIYATSTVISNTCMIPKDYSYSTNGKCLECKFCTKLTDDHKERLHLSRYIEEEAKYSENLYLAPILISRYCEPFLNETYIRHSLHVAQSMIGNGSQVIFRTNGINLEHPDVVNFLKSNRTNVQVQLKVFIGDTLTGNQIREVLCPNRLVASESLRLLSKLIENNVDAALLIDPYIIGINDADVLMLIKAGSRLGLKKVIIKQLFATEYFVRYLSTMVDKRLISLLSEQVGKFKTYSNLALLPSLKDLIEVTDVEGIDVSFCMNKEINQVLGIRYNNCCMLDNPVGVYDLSSSLMYRKKGYVIIRNNNAVHTD